MKRLLLLLRDLRPTPLSRHAAYMALASNKHCATQPQSVTVPIDQGENAACRN